MVILSARFTYDCELEFSSYLIVQGLECDGYPVIYATNAARQLDIMLELTDPIFANTSASRRRELAAQRLWSLILRFTGEDAAINIELQADEAA